MNTESRGFIKNRFAQAVVVPIMGVLAGGLLSMSGAKASDVCRDLPECRARLGEIRKRITELESAAGSVSLGSYLVDPSGIIKAVGFDEAAGECLKLGTRLPTPREYALHAISLGAKGILETRFAGLSPYTTPVQGEIQLMASLGYIPIHMPDGSVDFYYNHAGYLPRAGVEGSWDRWTSAPHWHDYRRAIVFDSGTGAFGDKHREADYVSRYLPWARCINPGRD